MYFSKIRLGSIVHQRSWEPKHATSQLAIVSEY